MLHIALSVRGIWGNAAEPGRCSTSPSGGASSGGFGSWSLRRRCSADGPPSAAVRDSEARTMLHIALCDRGIAAVGKSGVARPRAPKTIWGHAFKHQRWLMERSGRQAPPGTRLQTPKTISGTRLGGPRAHCPGTPSSTKNDGADAKHRRARWAPPLPQQPWADYDDDDDDAAGGDDGAAADSDGVPTSSMRN